MLHKASLNAWLRRHGLYGYPENEIRVFWEGDFVTFFGTLRGRLLQNELRIEWDIFIPANGSKPFKPEDDTDCNELLEIFPE